MTQNEHDIRQGGSSAHDRSNADVNELAQQFSNVARALQSHDDTGQMLAEVVASAVRLIPGVDDASISVVIDRRSVLSQHPSGPLPEQVDAIQTEVGQGPCLDSVYEHQTTRVPDMATEPRWPLFVRRAAALGAASMLAFQLYVEGDNLGALNLYARRPHAFDDESERVGLLFASHAAVAFANAQHIDELHHAVQTRDVIGQAKGILMERYNLTAVQAFQALVRVSQHGNTKILSVATDLTRTRRLPQRNHSPDPSR
jgi:transcriptional regulator with GAF, ATPase, and Fis domain